MRTAPPRHPHHPRQSRLAPRGGVSPPPLRRPRFDARARLQHRPRRRPHLLRVLPRDPLPRIEPGTTVSGVLDLTAAAGDSRCVRADASLETRETVVVGAGARRGASRGPGPGKSRGGRGGGKGARPPEGVGGDVRTHRGDAEDALRVGDSGGGAPDVRAANVAVRWVLRFGFYAAPARATEDPLTRTTLERDEWSGRCLWR